MLPRLPTYSLPAYFHPYSLPTIYLLFLSTSTTTCIPTVCLLSSSSLALPPQLLFFLCPSFCLLTLSVYSNICLAYLPHLTIYLSGYPIHLPYIYLIHLYYTYLLDLYTLHSTLPIYPIYLSTFRHNLSTHRIYLSSHFNCIPVCLSIYLPQYARVIARILEFVISAKKFVYGLASSPSSVTFKQVMERQLIRFTKLSFYFALSSFLLCLCLPASFLSI